MADNKAKRTLPLGSLSLGQLNGLKDQLEKEIDLFSSSFNQLKLAQQKFNVCSISLQELQQLNAETNSNMNSSSNEILVPLTSSVYVPGQLSPTANTVLIDIGTGYFVEKNLVDALTYYTNKISFMDNQLNEIQTTMLAKQETLIAIVSQMQLLISEQQSKSPTEFVQ